ncbi:hypothetical protein UA08_02043 [Talaromyces atroroseus]|uniref:C2H2-type domain-containing protein n=1 Tax=Talaromyces atroroseus TaxID=1441469 RepID=A0A1Q5QAP0_TALAT|nr:hypothetical protein UA08_02043 [Talaromyces atroroseus]OKL63017.1 hypothetical protein UA08_02043 [Talaromyces atroroseus]
MPREHPCTEPGCGKKFLRAEHLARHRLNHSPKQIFQCTSCPKRFVRKDLLRRHEERHAKGMWFRNSGGFVAADSSSSFDSQSQPMESTAMFTEPEQEDAVQMTGSDMSPVKMTAYQTTGETQNHQMAAVEAAQLERENAPIDFSHSIPPMEPIDFRNPGISDHPDPHNMNVSTPQFGEDQVTSLFLDPSINFPDPPLDFEWLFDNLSADLNSTGGSAGMPSGTSPHSNASLTDTSPPALPVPSPAHIRHPSSTQSSASSPWTEASPLLVAAIVTLGSTLSGDAVHYDAANKIHDSLRYLIFGTPDFDPPASLWCVQTLLIIQAHEKMFSTRKHHQLAHIFHGAIITLMKRGVAYQNTTIPTPGTTAVEQSWHQWIEMQGSNRTAFFGFVMDAQHSFMFGHTCVLSVHDVRLPLPCADILWECSKAEDWDRMMRKTPESPGFLPVLKRLLARTPIPPHCSPYSRFILLHGLFSVTAHLKARDSATLGVGRISTVHSPRLDAIDTWKETLERAMDTWSFSLVSRSSSLALEASRPLHRMAYVAIYTDINDIHILAGAPSLLGSLLSTNDRLRATARVRAWSERQESKKALYHCLLLIQESIFTGQVYRATKDNIALRPWSIYHASLILWAYGAMSRERNQTQQTHQDREKRISCSAEEYLVRMLMLLRHDSAEIDIVAQETSELLQAVRESLEGCRWELLQEAYDTLGRLVSNEPS